MQQEINFCIKADVNPGETVCVSGNCAALGDWILDGVLPLKCVKDQQDGEIWTGKALLPLEDTVFYRYVICIILESSSGKRQFVVRRWETNIKPRNHKVGDYLADSVHEFGIYGGDSSVQSGWMTVETLIQLKVYNNPIQIWKPRYANKTFLVKVTPIDLERHDSETSIEEDSTLESNISRMKSWPVIEISVMNERESIFSLQSLFGRVYNKDDFITFQAQVTSDKNAFKIDLYLHDPKLGAYEIPDHVGFCYILPSIFHQTTGVCVVPITGLRHLPVGQLTVEYLVIRPLQGYNCNLSVSYAKYWNHERKTLDVGHRGAGSSFKLTSCANIRENTIASLKHAGNHGADYVEFDVQLSKDMVPIIYHDFYVCISSRKKCDDNELFEVPVQDLTLLQLQGLKVHHVTEKFSNLCSFLNDDHEEHQPFPTLKKVLETIDPHVGFNVEIKWNLQLKDGSQELSYPMEINQYLDTILKEILENAGDRRIVISCFHPDICTMVRLKQNKYPVLFLTQGQSKKYPPYLDSRTSSIPMAIYFAQSAGILGIDVHTEDILEDRSIIKVCKDAGLIIFCWGEDNNDPKVIASLKDLGLDGVIYDRIDEHKGEKENIFLMEAKCRKGLLEAAGLSCNNNV